FPARRSQGTNGLLPSDRPNETRGRSSWGAPTPAELFAQLWEALADLLGTAATATLLRRAIQELGDGRPDLRDLLIRRDGLAYTFSVPASWHDEREQGVLALRDMARALQPILVQLTGDIVLRRLGRIDALRASGLFGGEEPS